MKNHKPNVIPQHRDSSKANYADAEKEALEEKRQQELGRDAKPDSIDKDKLHRPGNR